MSEEETELDVAKQRLILEQKILQTENEKHQSIKCASLIIEHCLYILWSHLDFYAIQAIAQSKTRCKYIYDLIIKQTLKSFHLLFKNFISVACVDLDDSTLEWRKLSELLPELKKGLVSIFTDSFIARLVEVHTEYTIIDQGFIKALVRRIKRLLQFIVIK